MSMAEKTTAATPATQESALTGIDDAPLPALAAAEAVLDADAVPVAALEVVAGLEAAEEVAAAVVEAAPAAAGAPVAAIWAFTSAEKVPVMPDIVYLDEKARAGKAGLVASLRAKDSKRTKLRNM